MPPKTRHLVFGTGQKRKSSDSKEKEAVGKKPKGGPWPVLTMVLEKGGKDYRVKVILDTGCWIPLFNQRMVEKLGILLQRHNLAVPIGNFTGQLVEGAGQYNTEPLLLRHQQHVTSESFNVAPMAEITNIFLPFWWIAKHPPQGAWQGPEVRFNSAECQEKCTKYEAADFSLTWNEGILHDPNVRTIGHVSAVTNKDALANVLMKFQPYMEIMSQEAADALPEHPLYGCKIELKDGSTAPCGPIYPLSEVELQTLKEWLKEMERTGKIKRSTSQARSPILFVPKPHR